MVKAIDKHHIIFEYKRSTFSSLTDIGAWPMRKAGKPCRQTLATDAEITFSIPFVNIRKFSGSSFPGRGGPARQWKVLSNCLF